MSIRARVGGKSRITGTQKVGIYFKRRTSKKGNPVIDIVDVVGASPKDTMQWKKSYEENNLPYWIKQVM